MNRQQALDEIAKSLGVLAHQVQQENLSGMYSKNRLIEDVFLPLFRILFSSPDLKNINTTGSNTAHLDLANSSFGLGIQITTDGSAGKIADTLRGVIDKHLMNENGRVVIFVLRPSRLQYRANSQSKWTTILNGHPLQFNPARDIIQLPALLSKIADLSTTDILNIRSELAKTVIGEDYVDVVSLVRAVSDKHLQYEKRTARYIPGVFVETRDTKQLCRSFCHPSLFLQRSVESARRENLESWNDFLRDAGLQLLEVPVLDDVPADAMLPDLESRAGTVYKSYEPFVAAIKDYEAGGSRRFPLPSATDRQRAFYEENAHVLANELPTVRYTVRDIVSTFESTAKRILLITGAAGQGKTNLLCDLCESFLVKHNIPCAFLSGREIGLKGGDDLAEVLRRLLFGAKVASLEDGIALLSAEALRLNKPFVLVIDGLNEHRNIGTFSHQLEYVVDSLLAYPGVRFLLSCRSEFFQQRFSNLMDGTLKPFVMLCEATETRLDDEEREALTF